MLPELGPHGTVPGLTMGMGIDRLYANALAQDAYAMQAGLDPVMQLLSQRAAIPQMLASGVPGYGLEALAALSGGQRPTPVESSGGAEAVAGFHMSQEEARLMEDIIESMQPSGMEQFGTFLQGAAPMLTAINPFLGLGAYAAGSGLSGSLVPGAY